MRIKEPATISIFGDNSQREKQQANVVRMKKVKHTGTQISEGRGSKREINLPNGKRCSQIQKL